MNYTLPFSKLSKNDANIAGGKGASLGEMLNAGIPVPDGFVVLSTTFDEFIKETELEVDIEGILDQVDHKAVHTVDEASEKIQEIIINAKMPKAIADEVIASFNLLGSEFVAVRSSATAEDGAEHAWAGQLESYLNTTKKDLLEKVQKCWASLFTPRAIFYRFEKGLHTTHISVAVVVQKMVNSEKSGIAFSVHPVTEDPNQLIIEAGLGLGEAIVSGSVTPDSYVVEKDSNNIIECVANHQNRALYRKFGGGNEWKDLDDREADLQVLSNEEILELSKIIMTVENHYGFPCDMEWAFEERKFYIVQSRPITTLKNKISKDIKLKILKNTFSREKPLYYFDLWNYCDRTGTLRYFSKEFQDNLFIKPRKGENGSVWHVEEEIKSLVSLATRALSKEGSLVWEKIKEDAWTAWNFIKPFAKEELFISDKETWKKYHDHLLLFWTAMNSIVWEAIDSPDVSQKIRDEFIQIRTESEKYVEITSLLAVRYFDENFPQYANISDVITFQEMYDISENKYSKEEISDFEKRIPGCYLLNGKIFLNINEINTVLEGYGLKLDNIEIENIFEIRGVCAMPGFARGRVRIIRGKNAIQDLKPGEILVTQMTSPDYLPAIKISAAIITDEGGSLCHAAIVSRELGVPCVIGTKIATQVLKDGDEVEVDADKGMVKIIEKKDAGLKKIEKTISRDWSLINTQALLAGYTFGMREWLGWSYSDAVFYFHDGFVDIMRLPDEHNVDFKNYVLSRINQDKNWFIKEHKTFVQLLNEINNFYLIHKDKISEYNNNDLLDFYNTYFDYIKKITGPFITMLWLPIWLEKDEKLASKYKEELAIAIDGRTKSENIFPEGEVLVNKFLDRLNVVLRLENKYLRVLSYNDVLSFVNNNQLPNKDELEERFIGLISSKEGLKVLGKQPVQDVLRELGYDYEIIDGSDLKEIKGAIAYKGVVKGFVKIVMNKEAISNFEEGLVLVASMTTPEYVPAMKKAIAFITDEGGVTCHAAIIAREMAKPCIIGTKVATQVLKDGDEVEVDADKGVVRKL